MGTRLELPLKNQPPATRRSKTTMSYWDANTEHLLGRKIVAVYMNDDYLSFEDENHTFLTFGVYGDCCSSSSFNDFIGLDKLLANGPVTKVKSIELNPGDEARMEAALAAEPDSYIDVLKFYGCAITTVSPVWGEQTTVFSFRNNSNGYYGGSLTGPSISTTSCVGVPRLYADVVVG